MILDVDHPIEFEENQIRLDIPYPEGITTKNKEWRIISLTPPVVSIHENIMTVYLCFVCHVYSQVTAACTCIHV